MLACTTRIATFLVGMVNAFVQLDQLLKAVRTPIGLGRCPE